MKIFNLLPFFVLLLNPFIFPEDNQEEKKYEKDGKVYTVNSNSLNIFDEEMEVSNQPKPENKNPIKKNKKSNLKLYPIFGQVAPLGENLRTKYNPGFSVGLMIQPEKTFKFFKKEWTIDAGIDFIKLRSINGADPFKITSLISHISSDFGPMILSFGLGYAHTSIGNQSKGFMTGIFDIGYRILETQHTDIILNLSFKEIMGGPNYSRNKGTSELYSLSLKFGTKI